MSITGEGEIEDSALAGLSFSPDSAAVSLNDTLDYGQANAGSFIFLVAMEPFKGLEQLIEIPVIKAGAVISYVDR